jgi:AraC-like DNA-binding protein
MVRKVHIDSVDSVDRPIVAVGNEHPDGHWIAPHHHRRGQLLSSSTGTLVVTTERGAWVMPPQRGMWIPPNMTHAVRSVGNVSMQSLYVEPEALTGMPVTNQVVDITPFMRSLLAEAMDVPPAYPPESRAGALMTLLVYELHALSALPLSLPYPARSDLAERCFRFLRTPDVHETAEQWSSDLGISVRSFSRLFRRETGLSFVTWRQQACLLMSLQRLAEGATVTEVATDLGYDNPASFTTMFKRVLGMAPRDYLRQPA